MAKKVIEIQNEIKAEFMSQDVLVNAYGITTGTFDENFSKVSIEASIIAVVAFSIWLLESLMDVHKKEVQDLLTKLIPGTARWYRQKALDFQYGYNLTGDADVYDNTALDDATIEASKIIKFAAVQESAANNSRLIVKIATDAGGELQPVSTTQKEAFVTYIEDVRYAGTPITVINFLPDLLLLGIRIFRDPLVLDENGVNRLTGAIPVEEALQEYMRELPFNGELVLQNMANKLEAIDGVEVVQIDNAETSWIDPVSGYGAYEGIDVKRIPVSGYFKIEDYTKITYVV